MTRITRNGVRYCIDGVTPHAKGNKTTSPIHWKDAEMILQHLKKYNPILAVCFHIGLRSCWRGSDIAKLKWKDIKSMKYLYSLEKKTKKHQRRAMHPALVRHLKEESEYRLGCLYNMRDNDPVYHLPVKNEFQKRKQIGGDNFQCTRRLEGDIRKVFQDLIPDWYEEQIATGWHSVRKTGARRVYDVLVDKLAAGKLDRNYSPIDVVSDILNHESISTTRRYIGLTQETSDWALTLEEEEEYYE